MMDRINKRLEDVKPSVMAAAELPGTRTTYSVFNRRSSAFIGSLQFFDGFLRARIPSREEGDHLQEICSWPASSLGALRKFHLGIVLEQFQGSIETTTYERASHYPFPKSFVAPVGFALERLRYAKRVYEKTAR
jgi:hypothetical protein